MAVITFNIPDTQLPRVIAAVCASRMSPTATPIPPTGANAKAVMVAWVTECVIAYEAELARKALPVVDVSTLVT